MKDKREIIGDDIPAPGEPLQPKVHESNQKLIDEEIQERARRIRDKLTRWEVVKLKWRLNRLRQKLIQYKWNALVNERWQLYQQLQQLRHQLTTDISHQKRTSINVRIMQIMPRGKFLDAAVKRLKPWNDEYNQIKMRLKAHADVVAWEKEDRENHAAFKREVRTWEGQIKAVCRQNARLHHLYVDSRDRTVIQIPKIERVVFKVDRVLFHIKTSQQNPIQRFFGLWGSALPYNVDVPDLISDVTLANLSAATRRVVTAEQFGQNLYWSISRLDSPDGIPRRYLYQKVLDYYPAADHAKTPWAAGVSSDRKIKWFNFSDHPHVLIAGTTQSGKSNHVNQMIATISSMNRPDDVRFVLVDNKGGIEFTHWRNLKHLLRPIVKSAAEVPDALKYVRKLMERRLAMFESIGAKNFESFNEKASQRVPRIVTVIDEMATLVGLGDLTTAIHTELRVISSQGRAVGIHLILCTQHPSVDVIPGWVKTNMGVRVAGKMPSHTASMIILDTVTAATLPDVAGRLAFSVGRSEIIAQSPYISDIAIARAVQISQEYPDPDNSEFVETDRAVIPVARPKFTEEDAIEMAFSLFDGQLAPSKIFAQIGKEIMSEREVRGLVDDIIERGLTKGIWYKDTLYKPRKIRKTHILEPVGQPVVPQSDEDTAKVAPVLLEDQA